MTDAEIIADIRESMDAPRCHGEPGKSPAWLVPAVLVGALWLPILALMVALWGRG